MKKVFIALIRLYQKIPISSHTLCRFQPTCSDYAIQSIESFGIIKGCFLAFKRIIRCNPFSKQSGFDPVPIKEKK